MGGRRKSEASNGEPKRRPSVSRLVKKLQRCLSLDLRHPDYPVTDDELFGATYGHCYIATEAVYHLWGRKAGYVPYVLKHKYGTHWRLVNEATGEIIDPTLPQLGGEAFAYHLGHRQAFLTSKPSARARELMRRMSRK
jgi:hypothetical protein